MLLPMPTVYLAFFPWTQVSLNPAPSSSPLPLELLVWAPWPPSLPLPAGSHLLRHCDALPIDEGQDFVVVHD